MSDEFIKIATSEINEEISALEKIMSTCQNDDDVLLNADKFEKCTHKIKGLAPMMGKEMLGSFSGVLDSILKKMIDGLSIDGVFSVFCDSICSMKQCMVEPDYDFAEINSKVSQILNNSN